MQLVHLFFGEGMKKAQLVLILVFAAVFLEGCADYPRVDTIIQTHLKPVALQNCNLQRFGDVDDGGYLLCANLLDRIGSVYSYGIDGRDNFGCSIARAHSIVVHQFDPFNTDRPACNNELTLFHEEGIADKSFTDKSNRRFDSLEAHIKRHGDENKPLLVKMDVEGAEWDSLLALSDATFSQIQQLTMEIHWLYSAGTTDKMERAFVRLSEHFYVAHVHNNNNRCGSGSTIFQSDVMEVTYVNKNVARLSTKGEQPVLPHPLDAANVASYSTCDLTMDAFTTTSR